MTSPILARDPLAPCLLSALASLAMVACGGTDDRRTLPAARTIWGTTASDASVSIALIAHARLAAGRRVAVDYGHDKLAAEANFINGITLSINGGKYLS
ncbi:hypothetical protein [Accumulibacter sp.]|uniref:hypothetical protein n=1 Tax=Accumulibacter sp. TaxID=2053492 RepID=UPI0026099801|nr:hypothetical protein [Accumulibacter sp.]